TPVTKLITAGGLFAEGSYMACIHSYAAEGLPLSQVYELCATQLSAQSAVGFADGASFTMPANSSTALDVGSVPNACGHVDARHSLGYGEVQYNQGYGPFAGVHKYGRYTWGDAPGYLGLTNEESAKLKNDRVVAAEHAYLQYLSSAEIARRTGNAADRQKAQQDWLAWKAARKLALEDPNLGPQHEGHKEGAGTTHDGDDGTGTQHHQTAPNSACASVREAARELVAECHRTGWKATPCQQLMAKMKGCADPTLIYVDPDAGYACAPTVDPQLVIDAWTRLCEQNTTSGPEGGSPCNKPNPSSSGRTMQGDDQVLCGNPIALTDPETDGCIAVLQIDTFGDTDIGGLIVWGQGVFGGPIVVLPQRDPVVIAPGDPR
ncbi:MAG: hypothetical protein JNL26_07210, partial [Gemmatimonadetes bacterium]|nr:hypothetical protein [Gemmatimonadota bacterium]